MLLLGYDQFQFIKVLIKNRWTVLYCTLLAKTEGEEDRAAIEEEMKADPDKAAVLRVSCVGVGYPCAQPLPSSTVHSSHNNMYMYMTSCGIMQIPF